MSEKNDQNCNHVCEGCSVEGCGSRENMDLHVSLNDRSKVNKTIAIISGKGGVGKSMVTSLLASSIQKKGYRSAVLDGDITGPSQAKAFGLHDKAVSDGELIYPMTSQSGVQVISTNMLLEDESQPVIWRGPMVAGILKQFYTDVYWDNVDYMFIDMPPGTSDVPLTLFQSIPLDGIIIVTSPQDLVSNVVEKAINMALTMNIPILGIVENMSYIKCPTCDEIISVFGKSHTFELANKYNLEVLAKLPIDSSVTDLIDQGRVDEANVEEINDVVEKIISL